MAQPTGEVVDIIQVPVFVQTNIDLRAAAETGKPILIKKGQFMSPEYEKLDKKIRILWKQKNYTCR